MWCAQCVVGHKFKEMHNFIIRFIFEGKKRFLSRIEKVIRFSIRVCIFKIVYFRVEKVYNQKPFERQTFCTVFPHLSCIKFTLGGRSIHSHRTRSATQCNVLTPSCKRNSGLRTFHPSACRLRNNLGNTYRNIISHSNFRITLQNDFIKGNSSLGYFKIIKTF